ncbi:catenin delta-1-like [Rhincodon typus]|uniref:catenin delta-1-like n=1 Tax=Rhincodon typus TaxID=259920 RepID=UPI00202F7D48|nr:catenin delta-1-like [Rhincodon typus]XP_048477250.1 catenin delta-1-like [Rhincodon typus]
MRIFEIEMEGLLDAEGTEGFGVCGRVDRRSGVSCDRAEGLDGQKAHTSCLWEKERIPLYGRYIRSVVRQEKGLSSIAERLTHENDRVVKAVSGALRNLSLDARNKELIGKHAMPNLICNLPSSQDSSPSRNEDTVVSILQTINEVAIDNVEAAKKLRELQGVEKLVLMNKSNSRSEREIKAVGTVLQTLWGYKELRKQLEKDGWKKADFQMVAATNRGVSGNAYDDSTLPLIEKNQRGGDKREMIPMDDLGPDAYSTLDHRDRNRTLDRTLDRSGDYSEREPLKND